MRKIIIGVILLCITSYGETKIINNCKDLDILKTKLKQQNPYGNKKVLGLQYGLKNKTNKKVEDIKIVVFLKDKNGTRIYDKEFTTNDLKPHYELPFSEDSYYSMDTTPSSYGGDADIQISCKGGDDLQSTKSKFTKINVPTELYESIKNQTETKTPLETQMSIVMALKVMHKVGGLKKMIEKLKK